MQVSDLAAYYQLIVEKILHKDRLTSGREGYYFAVAHEMHWWEVLDRLAILLHSRGLIDSPETSIWPSDGEAAAAYQIPAQWLRIAYDIL